LIVDQIGRHTAQGQVPKALADDFVGGGEADKGRESFNGDVIAIVDVECNSIAHGDDFHSFLPSLSL
jgi:hypothetical protein